MIIAGFGFRHGATEDSFADALARASGGRTVDAIATLAGKVHDLARFAMRQNLRVIPVSPEAAEAMETLSTSEVSLAVKSLPSVAEATALAAAGPDARLIAPRVISADRMVTCAIAEARP